MLLQLQPAYLSPNSMFYDAASNTLAIAGTHSFTDVLTDLTIPFGQLLNHTPRYESALKLWSQLGKPNLVGHSLGGGVADHIAARASLENLLSGKAGPCCAQQPGEPPRDI